MFQIIFLVILKTAVKTPFICKQKFSCIFTACDIKFKFHNFYKNNYFRGNWLLTDGEYKICQIETFLHLELYLNLQDDTKKVT